MTDKSCTKSYNWLTKLISTVRLWSVRVFSWLAAPFTFKKKFGVIDYTIVYPIKGLPGIQTHKWHVDRFGLLGHHQYRLATYDKESHRYTELDTEDHRIIVNIAIDNDTSRFVFKYGINEGEFKLPFNVSSSFIQANSTNGGKLVQVEDYSGYVVDKALPEDFLELFELPSETVLISVSDDTREQVPLLLINGAFDDDLDHSVYQPNVYLKNVPARFSDKNLTIYDANLSKRSTLHYLERPASLDANVGAYYSLTTFNYDIQSDFIVYAG